MSEQFRARAIAALEGLRNSDAHSHCSGCRQAFTDAIGKIRALPCEPKGSEREAFEWLHARQQFISWPLEAAWKEYQQRRRDDPAPAAQGDRIHPIADGITADGVVPRPTFDYVNTHVNRLFERIAALEKRQAETEAIVARNQRAFEDFLRQLPTAIASQIDIGLKFGPNKIAGEGGGR